MLALLLKAWALAGSIMLGARANVCLRKLCRGEKKKLKMIFFFPFLPTRTLMKTSFARTVPLTVLDSASAISQICEQICQPLAESQWREEALWWVRCDRCLFALSTSYQWGGLDGRHWFPVHLQGGCDPSPLAPISALVMCSGWVSDRIAPFQMQTVAGRSSPDGEWVFCLRSSGHDQHISAVQCPLGAHHLCERLMCPVLCSGIGGFVSWVEEAHCWGGIRAAAPKGNSSRHIAN